MLSLQGTLYTLLYAERGNMLISPVFFSFFSGVSFRMFQPHKLVYWGHVMYVDDQESLIPYHYCHKHEHMVPRASNKNVHWHLPSNQITRNRRGAGRSIVTSSLVFYGLCTVLKTAVRYGNGHREQEK